MSSHEGASVILDLGVLGSLLYLIRTNKVSEAWQAWQFLRYRRHKRIKIQLSLALASDLLRLLALPFIGLWFFRWVGAWPDILGHLPSAQEMTYLDACIGALGISSALDARWLGKLLARVHMTSGRQVLLHYGAAIVLGTVFMLMPFSLNEGQNLKVIDAVFVVISALSVTGLSPIDVGAVLSFPGQVILLILIQLGGLGIVLITAGFSIATFERLSLNSVLLGREMYSSCRVGDVPQFLARVVGLTVALEAFGALLIYFSLPPDMSGRWFYAVFHAISAFCNAGFALDAASLSGSAFGFFSISVLCCLIVLGGFGFPLLLDLGSAFQEKRSRGVVTPHMRLTLTVMVVLLVVGTLFFFLLESLRPSADLGHWERLGQSVFYSISSRTAGFGMVPVETFHFSALFGLILLMAVGANPSSTGGGMKTTTIGVLLMSVWHTLRGSHQTVFSKRAIPSETVARALTIVVLYLATSGLALTLLVISEEASPFALGFEVISALSTVGLSMGITAGLSSFGKIIIMFLMLFGRIGILSIVLAGLGHVSPSRVRYPEDDFFVG
nr:TrkH family potassium uptake protein [Bdellovibrio sp. HAGR004]